MNTYRDIRKLAGIASVMLVAGLWAAEAGAWGSANRFGGSTEHSAGQTSHENRWGEVPITPPVRERSIPMLTAAIRRMPMAAAPNTRIPMAARRKGATARVRRIPIPAARRRPIVRRCRGLIHRRPPIVRLTHRRLWFPPIPRAVTAVQRRLGRWLVWQRVRPSLPATRLQRLPMPMQPVSQRGAPTLQSPRRMPTAPA